MITELLSLDIVHSAEIALGLLLCNALMAGVNAFKDYLNGLKKPQQ